MLILVGLFFGMFCMFCIFKSNIFKSEYIQMNMNKMMRKLIIIPYEMTVIVTISMIYWLLIGIKSLS